MLVSLGFGDPGTLSNFRLATDGKLVISELKVGKLTLDSTLAIDGTEATGAGTLAYQLMNLDNRVRDLENGSTNPNGPSFAQSINNLALAQESQANQLSQIASDSAQLQQNVAGINIKASDLANSVASTSATLASLQQVIDSLIGSSEQGLNPRGLTPNLTPPDFLIATGSAQLANLSVSSQISTLKIDAQIATVAANFKVTGDTQLASTNIAGDFVQDGTFSITSGNAVNVAGSLHLQNNILAGAVDFFNGLITLTKEGEVKANTVLVAEIKVVSGKTTGNAKIPAGAKSIDVVNPLVKLNSRILITPTTSTDRVLAVTAKVEETTPGSGRFTVSTPVISPDDISFDWWILNEEPPSNHDP